MGAGTVFGAVAVGSARRAAAAGTHVAGAVGRRGRVGLGPRPWPLAAAPDASEGGPDPGSVLSTAEAAAAAAVPVGRRPRRAPPVAGQPVDLPAQRLGHHRARPRAVVGPLGQQREDQRLEVVGRSTALRTRGGGGVAVACCAMIVAELPVNGVAPVADS